MIIHIHRIGHSAIAFFSSSGGEVGRTGRAEYAFGTIDIKIFYLHYLVIRQIDCGLKLREN